MRVQRMVVPLSLALMGLGGCNPYDRWTGEEVNSGPVDAQNFPAAYLGTGANRQRAGSGRFVALKANVAGATTDYFRFPLSSDQLAALRAAPAEDPQEVALTAESLPTPSAYVFDRCDVPEGYSFDLVRDGIRYDEQGVIFSALPRAAYNPGATPTWSYVPIVARVPVTSKGAKCQAIKSETTVAEHEGKDVTLALSDADPSTGKRVGEPDGTYHAFAIIEPGAAVRGSNGAPANGVGLQKWGWYNQYLLAYLDGGQIPTTEDGKFGTQKLYYPRSTVGGKAVSLGGGYDVLTARRGQPGYSPVCEVWTYDTGGDSAANALPTSATDIESDPVLSASLQRPAGGDPYVYCLQIQ
ncbi:hypothetical protein [Cystobacter fuscus]|uniref:hypothetical protein n=1 Tax=Cystobacter fuscus TaxID=43 RepID=UPI002B2F9E6D|nr:hypothetical protein F0U63_20875 [Cystobacter fuscus]